MAKDKITMLKLKRMLQLLDSGWSLNNISRDLHMSKRTVHNYKQSAVQSGIPMCVLRQMDDQRLHDLLQPPSPVPTADERKAVLDQEIETYLAELKKPYVTALLVWEMYHERHPDGYQYTQFKKYLLDSKKSKEYSYHNVYVPGYEMQIDFAGDKLYYKDKSTGGWTGVVVLCCILPYSNKSFAIALSDATQENLFYGLGQCLSDWGKAPKLAKSDNMKQWVRRGSQFERPFTESTDEWATYYDIIPDVARVRKPRDKGPVEGMVSQIYKFIYARIRNEVYYSLADLNRRIFELMDEYNNRPMHKSGKSRNELFYGEEYAQMHDIPDKPFMFRYRKENILGSDYHVIVGKEQHRYSVPYQYVNKPVTVLWDMESVEIYFGLTRIAVHRRKFEKFGHTTEESHMPPNHQAYKRSKEMGVNDYLSRALTIGPEAKWAVEKLIGGAILPQYAYRNCQSFFNFASKYGEKRVEAACSLIHQQTEVFSFQMLRNMIEKNMDKATESGDTAIISCTPHNDNVRGAASYQSIN